MTDIPIADNIYIQAVVLVSNCSLKRLSTCDPNSILYVKSTIVLVLWLIVISISRRLVYACMHRNIITCYNFSCSDGMQFLPAYCDMQLSTQSQLASWTVEKLFKLQNYLDQAAGCVHPRNRLKLYYFCGYRPSLSHEQETVEIARLLLQIFACNAVTTKWKLSEYHMQIIFFFIGIETYR